jgi:UDP-3-O-[3-hydroxymyristoyl] N-acetylglucosamine deacetylase
VKLLGGGKYSGGKPKYYTVEPVYYLNGKTSLVILPDKELNITYSVNYDHPDLRGKWVSYNKPDEIIEARTFGFYKDLKKFQALGFAKGVTFDNTVGLTDNSYTTDLRSELEPAKHKILDLIGDLHLAGVNPLNLKAQILVKEAGHAVHIKAAKMLKDKLKECK